MEDTTLGTILLHELAADGSERTTLSHEFLRLVIWHLCMCTLHTVRQVFNRQVRILEFLLLTMRTLKSSYVKSACVPLILFEFNYQIFKFDKKNLY